jgi:dihydroorotase
VIYIQKVKLLQGGASFIDMPNTVPNILTVESLKEKYAIASKKSLANYSLGVNGDNIDEIIKPIPVNSLGFLMTACTLPKTYLLTIQKQWKNYLLTANPLLPFIPKRRNKTNEQAFREQYGEDVPVKYHPIIRVPKAVTKLQNVRLIWLKKRPITYT